MSEKQYIALSQHFISYKDTMYAHLWHKNIILPAICAIIIGILIFTILSNFHKPEGYSGWMQYMRDLNSGKVAPHHNRGSQTLVGTNMSPIGQAPAINWTHVGRIYSKSNANDKQLILESKPHYARRNAYIYRVVQPRTGMPIKINVKKSELLGGELLTIPGFSDQFVVEIDNDTGPTYNPYVL